MNYLYSLFSLVTLWPLFLIVRKLSASFYPYTRFGALVVITLFMVFHLYIFHFKEIPFLGIAVPEDNEFMVYAPFLYGLLCTIVSMKAFK